MKFTLSWLKEHLEFSATVQELTDKLTMIGLELEGIEDRAKDLDGFVTARVLKAERHPQADRLQVCQVDTGSGVIEVVCGAPNARAGLIGAFARSGLRVPGTGVVLETTKIRGVTSNGMLLSEREMGLSDDHGGIVELPEGTPIGAPVAEIMGLADPVIDVAITPNRGDCLGVRGIARDLAAAGFGTLKPIKADPVPGRFDSPIKIKLEFTPETASACPMFAGRLVRGVKNGPSPKWLQDRLKAIGLRPISALVDITNLITFEYGRPLHVFDTARLHGDIRARMAKPGEKILALNGKEYELDDSMTVIADERQAEAIAGIMGGEISGCTETTADVFIESAYFDPVRTAMTGRKLGVTSDARYRFERGVDPTFVAPGCEIATRWILELCGGEPSHIMIAGREPAWKREILMRPSRVMNLGGVEVPEPEVERILTALGCAVAHRDKDMIAVTPPAWRGDIEHESCLVEEVARLWGFDRIPPVSMPRLGPVPAPALTPEQKRRSLARRTLAARGMIEAVTYSFLPAKQAELFGGGKAELKLVNPISADLDVMRPSVLPNLIAACARNGARGYGDGALFEIGPQYAGDKPADQVWIAGGIRAGGTPRNWAATRRHVDAFDAKADALAVLAALGVAVETVQVSPEAPGWYHPGRSGSIKMGPKNVLAWFGEIHPRVRSVMDIAGPMVGFEVFLDNLPKPKAGRGAAKPMLKLSAFQPLERDFAFVVDERVTAETILKAVRAADKGLITDASVFDLFAGAALGPGKKSVAVSVTLQPTERTLTDMEIEAVGKKIVEGVVKATGGSLRG